LYSQGNALSQTIANNNTGIAMSQIAQSGLQSQQEILSNIQTLSQQAMTSTTSQEGRDAIAQQISSYLDQFDQIAQSTTYNGKSLLTTSGDSTDDISVVGSDNIVGMSKADTTSVSDSLRSFLSDFASEEASMQNMLKTAKQGTDQLASYASDFGSASNALEVSTKTAMQNEVSTASARSTILDTDYSKEVSSFSKSNLLTQVGYIMQVQSNAQQQKTIALLT